MEIKRFVVLANSYKKKPGRCVAGRELGNDNAVGNWLRPISDLPEGELHPHHMRIEGGRVLSVFDIVGVPVADHARDIAHPEDWRIKGASPWQRIGIFPQARLASLEERPADLWVESDTRTNRVSSEFLARRTAHQSLYLVRPKNFRVELTNDFNPWEGHHEVKRRACFTYNGLSYSLGLTDPVFIDTRAKRFPEEGEPAIVVRPSENCLICVSLTPKFERTGYHYKVVATVLELP